MRRNENSIEVFLVPHTHWDREWYLPKPGFSLLLVALVDRLIDILDREPDYRAFMFDGQTIALEDYLELNPDAEARIRRYVEAGRIIIGPWYVLPDEVLISGEAHIRNFLAGRRVCDAYGGGMMIGYLPDSFGHPSQMPQILRGLGLAEMVFWRGLGPEIEKSEFIWRGFDGTTVLGLNMPLGYGVGAALPSDDEGFLKRIEKRAGELAELSRIDAVLLMNGVDHLAPERDLPGRIRRANAAQRRYRIRLSALGEYVESARARLDEADLPVAQGELRSGYRAYLLGGTLSTRIYLKQHNALVESLLERELEPLLSTTAILGVRPYPSGIMNHLWRRALANLPHDSICGCSVDAIHRHMLDRFAEVTTLGSSLRDEFLVTLGARAGGREDDLIVFNPHPHPVDQVVETEVDLLPTVARRVDHEDALLVEYATAPVPRPARVSLLPPDGEAIEAEIVGCVDAESMRLSLDDQPVMYRVARTRIRFPVRRLPPMGYRLYRIEVASAPAEPDPTGERRPATESPMPVAEVGVENEWYRVSPEPSGSVRVLDRRSGREFAGLIALEDAGDSGDEYTWCPPETDRVVRPAPESIAVAHPDDQTLVVRGLMRIPTGLSDDRNRRRATTAECRFTTTVRLPAGARRIDIRIEFENNVSDHRLSVLFPTDFRNCRCRSESTFCVEERAVDAVGAGYEGWMEPPTGVFPQKAFTSLSDGETILTVFNRGLPECELRNEPAGATLSLTLLRCVGYLSRVDLSCRRGNAGWPLPTPEAQCRGRHTFESALAIQAESDMESIPREARLFLTPPIVARLRPPLDPDVLRDASTLPREASLFRLDGPPLFLSAIKPAEAGRGWIIRVVNPFPRNRSGALVWRGEIGGEISRIVECTLAEIDGEELEIPPDGRIRLDLRGGEIRTLRVETTTDPSA